MKIWTVSFTFLRNGRKPFAAPPKGIRKCFALQQSVVYQWNAGLCLHTPWIKNEIMHKASVMLKPYASRPNVKDDSIAVGVQLKKLRKGRGWSLSQLGLAADVSVGLLSQIERGRSIPSLRTLTKLRIALDVSLGTLVGQSEVATSEEARFIKRRENRETLVIGDNSLVKEFLSPVKSEHLQFMLLDIPSGGGSGAQTYKYDGEKAGLVIEGSLELRIGEELFQLREGDSFHFDSSIPHAFENRGNMSAKVIWIICKTHERVQI